MRCLDGDRDVNVAKNILALGHEHLAVGISTLLLQRAYQVFPTLKFLQIT